jgi:hypothetical protein
VATAFFNGNFFAGEFFNAAVAPPTINYQGDGKKRRKRRNRTAELFDALEQTLRAELAGPVVADAEVYAVAALPAPRLQHYADELAALRRTLDAQDQLQARLVALQDTLADHAARQRAQQLLDDEDEWMMMA